MKKIIVIALATIAIAAAALIAVPALANGFSPKAAGLAAAAATTPTTTVTVTSTVTPTTTPVVTTPVTGSLYAGYGPIFCGGGLVMNDTVTLQRVAATLGITYDQLVQDLNNGQTIASIAAAQNVDISKVVDTVVAAQTDMVNVLVKYGYITQDQANTIIADLRTRVEAALSATTPTSTAGYGYGCYGIVSSGTAPVTGSSTAPVTGYGYGMMGGLTGRGMMGW